MRENAKPDAINEATAKLSQEEKRRIAEQAVKVDQRSNYTVNNGIVEPLHTVAPYSVAVTAAELCNMNISPIEWRLEKILPVGVVAMLSAKPKMYKSFLALGMCLSICQGKPYLGYKSKKCGCLYFDLESGHRRPKSRLEMMLQGDEAPANLYMITRDDLPDNKLPKLHEDFEPMLFNELDAHPDIGVVVIDVFTKIRKRKKASDDSYERDYADLDSLVRIAEQNNITIMLIHHNTKGEKSDVFDNALGSAGIMGALDVAWNINRQRHQKDADLYITGRDLEEQQLTMYFDDQRTFRWYLLGTKEEIEAKRLRDEYYDSNISRAIKQGIREHFGSYSAIPSEIIAYGDKHNLPIAETPQQVGTFINTYIENGIFEEDGISIIPPKTSKRRQYLFAKKQ